MDEEYIQYIQLFGFDRLWSDAAEAAIFDGSDDPKMEPTRVARALFDIIRNMMFHEAV